MIGEDGQALLSLASRQQQAGNLTPSLSRDRLTSVLHDHSRGQIFQQKLGPTSPTPILIVI
jgi:hypothetical protein